MSMKRIVFLLIVLALCVCIFAGCTDKPFVNPGDFLGGGGTGTEASKAEDVTDNVADALTPDDLGNLSQNTSEENATPIAAAEGVTEITASGTYLFKGTYGGLRIVGEKLKLHFIFDGAAFTAQNAVAIDGTSQAKKTELTITLKQGTVNNVANSGLDEDGKEVNAVHIKGSLAINGTGELRVTSESKNALKSSKELQVVDAALTLSAANHAISALSVTASGCKINVLSAGKDGINAECDDETTAFTTEEGFVYLQDVEYSCVTAGDGIQADTAVYIDGGTYNIKTNGTFVSKTQMSQYGLETDDFKYILENGVYKRIASDETGRYSAGKLYGLVQGCKGIKVGEIEYPDPSNEDEEIAVTDGDYSIIIDGGTFAIDSTDDAIHTNSGNLSVRGGSFTLSTYDDAMTSDVLTKITGGEITISKSYEGIEGGYVEIEDGSIRVTSSDDGINAASDDAGVTEHIIISGGEIYVNAEGDGVDSNGSINMTGGPLVVFGPTMGGNAALDADKGILINGGYLFAVGPTGMVETPANNSKQNVLSYAQSKSIGANTVLSLTDGDDKPIFSVTVEKTCQSVIVSCPELATGKSFKLYGGDTQLCTFTVSSVITVVGSQGNMGNPGGTPPDGFGGGFGGGRGPGGR